ncbi:translation initiation factor IF-2 [Candidatus Parcubacteria bacterium]|nr:translation initiation factor IF-2 [Patescibacteria group bacterium]MCG2686560.1 translation initiation factor IF-2 [Candidatus Parcubacteria bacterium]
MNITELARQTRIPTPKLREILPELGFDIGMKAIQVDDRIARKIIDKLNNAKVRDQVLNSKTNTIEENKNLPAGASKDSQEAQAGVLNIGGKIIVKDLAKQMNIPVTKLILELMKNNVMAALNQEIDYETAAIIAEDLGFTVEKAEGEKINLLQEKKKREEYLQDDEKNLTYRPPIVTIMGHVDHGKTKLLDAIRETNVVEGEAGGITQHIGAYQVEKNNQLITFIDTPGHEAFSAMRSRGAQVADIVILLIAADDGIQPQTIESISHIRSAHLPFIVAINKIDRPEANIDKIKSELAELNLTPEDWGGKTICAEISAKEKQNIDGLLDTLLLVYEMEKEKIKANPNRLAVGTIIESHLDKGEGPVATVLIQTGALKKSDAVKIGNVLGKIKIMKDWQNHIVETAPPSMPVKIIGLKSVPEVGEILEVVTNIKHFKKELKKKKSYKTISTAKIMPETKTPTQNTNNQPEIQKINIILKTDVVGSQEPILESLENLQQSDIILNVVQCGLGDFTEVDIERAVKQDALLIGFNVNPNSQAELLARDKNIEIKTSKIIYELLDFLKGKMNDILKPKIKSEIIGKMQVLKIFRTEKDGQILGGKIIEGKIIPKTKLKIYRNNNLIGIAELTELQSAKQIVSEVLINQEAGLKISGFNEVQENDIIEIIKEEKIERKI